MQRLAKIICQNRFYLDNSEMVIRILERLGLKKIWIDLEYFAIFG